MTKKEISKKIPIIVTTLLGVTLIIAVFFLMNFVQGLLNSDVKINIQEIAVQNSDAITSRLKLEVNNLNQASGVIAGRLKEKGAYDEESMEKTIHDFGAIYGDTRTFIANMNGESFFSDERNSNISGRQYFRLASKGVQNISERLVSRYDGTEIFVISVPLYFDNKIIGTAQRTYSIDEMYEICRVSLFSDQGYMHIVNSEGYIIVGSDKQNYYTESENYFKSIYAQGNHDKSKRISEDVKNNKSGFMETVIDGQKIFSAYTPMEEIHDWYLISSVAHSAVSPNANAVIRMFYFILMVVVLTFAVILFYFLSFKKQQKENLEEIAFVDSVTKGDTFNKFIIDCQGIFKEEKDIQYSMLFFDIDNFKYFNSYFGFSFGDRVLQTIYVEIKSKLMGDERIARIYADHFVILLEDASDSRLKNLLNFDVININHNVSVYTSSGYYTILDTSELVTVMVDKARMAARSGKGIMKKDVVQYTDKFDTNMLKNEQLKREIIRGLADKEFIPYFQPKVDIRTRKLVGAEALARWRTRDGRMISPAEFIEVCEQTGMITDLDMSIFEQVLIYLAQRIREGVHCYPISVNFSRVHLGTEEFLEHIVTLMDAHNVPHHLIEIELTESVVFDNQDIILDFANRLHEQGLHLDIDDFGSGYSSLNMLKDIPVDILKIDKGFLDDTTNSERQRTIIKTIAEMAKQLHIGVVVEGAETEENLELMRECGCFIAQGYYFSKPLPEEDFDEIFRKGEM